jgi:signal transduction histidine kinase
MERIDDEMLLEELRRRLEENAMAVSNLRAMTQNLEKLNEKLRQSEALKTDFLSNIRNEINNPLASIMGMAKQIMDKNMDAETVRSMLAAVYHEAFDLDFQLRNIFAAAELEAGETQMSLAKVDVAALVRGQIAAFEHKAVARSVTLAFNCPACARDGSFVFTTDPDKLQKVLANLLANAIEFNIEGKSVTVTADRSGIQLKLSIADEGFGIPEQDQKRIFDRFVQIDTGVRKRYKGHGLGLSIVKALVEMLGGKIELSGRHGQGCVFTVAVPEMESATPVDIISADGNEFIFDGDARF